MRGRREGGSTHEAWVSEGEGGREGVHMGHGSVRGREGGSTHGAWVSEGEEGGREYTWGMGQ